MVNIPQRKKRINNKKCSLKAVEQLFVAISFLSILFVIHYNFSISKSFESASTLYNHIQQTDCTQYYTKFLNKEIPEVEEQKGFSKAYVTRTTSSYPFYWSTHSPELDPIRTTSFEKGNYYEFQLSMRVIEAIEEGKKNGDEVIFLDVGANIGWFSLLARSYGATNVYSFEPNPVNVLRMCESLTLNHWKEDDSVHIMQMGVGNKDEKKILHQFNPNPGAYTFDEVRVSNYKDKEKAVGEFQIKKLDTFAEEMGWFQRKQRIAFFKLDVEGYEHAVIEGARKLIEARLIKYVSFEFNAKRGYKEVEPMINVFFESGYELYMHGRMRGPSNKVEKKYSSSSDLTSDVIGGTMYGENLLFRLK